MIDNGDQPEGEDVSYDEVSVEPWTACQRYKYRGSLHVTGTCSRCGHRTDVRFGPVVVSQVAGGDALAAEQRAIECDCGKEHAGREKDAIPSGCGAIWWGSELDG